MSRASIPSTGASGRVPPRGLLALVLALASVLLSCAALPPTPSGGAVAATPTTSGQGSTEATAAPGELRVHFLDVGQGDASLLVGPDAAMLIDAGRHDSDDLLPHLRALGITHIDVVAITHAHADHIGQLDEVLASVDVDEVWMPGTPATSRTFEEAIAALEASDAAYEEPRAGGRTQVGSLIVDIVHPSQLTGEQHPDTLAMRVTWGSVSFLFTGDAEADAESEMVARAGDGLAATVYQVGHHGSSTSTSPELLAAVRPAVAVYSAGTGNSYGHPDPGVLARLADAGAAVYGTDVNGTVTVATDGLSYRVTTTDSAETPGTPAPTTTPATQPSEGAGCRPGQVDVNTASVDELERITGIGPALAKAIVALRPYEDLENVLQVDGIGEATLVAIREEALACAS